jgi:hypothetical protein
MEYKYKISVISQFKNESMIMDEWMQHNISEGIQHFYLIDNGSTDNYLDILNKYIEKITLVVDSYRHPETTQNVLMNKYFLDLVKNESEWTIICDMDEYIYSRNEYKTIFDYVNNIPDNIEKIILPWKNFGSNNIIKQPSSIVSSFTMYEEANFYKERVRENNWRGHCKTLIKTQNLKRLEIHCPELNINDGLYFSDFSEAPNINLYNISSQNLHINHYQHMSLEYYRNVKMIRGDGQGQTNNYNLNRFESEKRLFNWWNDYELHNKKIKLSG